MALRYQDSLDPAGCSYWNCHHPFSSVFGAGKMLRSGCHLGQHSPGSGRDDSDRNIFHPHSQGNSH